VTNTKDFFSSPSASRICSGGRSSRRAIIELFQFVEPAAVIQRGFGEFCLSLLFSFLGFNSLFACKISCGEFGVLLELGLNISLLDSWTVPFGVGILVICLKTRAFFLSGFSLQHFPVLFSLQFGIWGSKLHLLMGTTAAR